MLYIFLIFIITIAIGTLLFLQHPLFGKSASGERLITIQNSKNFKDGKFQNLSETPDLTEGVTYPDIFKDMFFNKSEYAIPTDSIPTEKINLLEKDIEENFMVWFYNSDPILEVNINKNDYKYTLLCLDIFNYNMYVKGF